MKNSNIEMFVNGQKVLADISRFGTLADFLRYSGNVSVKRGCESSACGLCSVIVDDKIVLSCSYPLARAANKHVLTLEGIQEEAIQIGKYFADEGAEQCGFCSPALVLSIVSLKKCIENPTDDEILEFLSGNMCRCSGYQVHLRAIRKYLNDSNKFEPALVSKEVQ